jgi:hypothetical protein
MKCSVLKLLLCLTAVVQSAASFAQAGKVVRMNSSFLRPLQKRDSILIADQLKYGFELKGVPEGTRILLPDYSNGFADSSAVEVVKSWTVDTLKVNKAGKKGMKDYDIEGSVVISAFEAGKFLLPSIRIGRVAASGSLDTLVFDPKMLDVKTIPIDTVKFKVHDIKGQIRYPVTFREIFPYLAGFDLFATLAIVVACLLMMRKKKSKGSAKSDEPAHIIALRKLDHFRGDKYWAPEKQKIFYSGITDALREYIVARYGVEAMEMTTAEIFSGLKGKGIPQDLFEELKNLFVMADYVKFAKHVADNDENSSALPLAVKFVTSTYQEQLDRDQADAAAKPVQAEPDKGNDKEDNSAYMPK